MRSIGQGDEKGNKAALEQSIEIWRLVLEQHPRERVPLDWATALAIDRLTGRQRFRPPGRRVGPK